MESDNKYAIQGLDEYLRQSEPERQQRGGIWQTSIGLQLVDRLTPSEYLLQTARRHIEGDINLPQAKELIDSYYRTDEGRKQTDSERTEEADKVSVRIAELLSENTFAFTPAQYTTIHRRLFEGLFKFAGLLRNYNITKREWILNSDTVLYSSHELIAPTLDYDFAQERTFDYSTIGVDQSIAHLARFCSDLWQIHAFGEGNTRTTAVFMIKYLRSLGFNVSNEPFAKHSWYFRNALVRANYNNLPQNIQATITYLERFFRNLMLGEQNVLRNRELHINWQQVSPSESATQSAKFTPTCKNCTLEETAVLKVIESNPNVTQKEIAKQIGKSERTIKSITVRLTERGLIVRENGRRNGHWRIIKNE